MKKGKLKKNNNLLFFIKKFQLSFIIFLIFSIGFIPITIYSYIIYYFFEINKIIIFILLPIILYLGIVILIISQLIISGSFIKIFNIKYKSGKYNYNYLDKNSFKWILNCSLYTPCRKIIEIFPVGKLKNIYYKLIGMKIGKNSLIGGIIKDPCITSFGNNVTMGEYSIIYGHIHNYKEGKIVIKNIKIGNNCIIGAGSIIMPGAILEDDTVLASGAVVIQDQILEKGKIYGGIPAKEIKNEKN
jgi:acetyltransferase-like isoleucine patch superfamily enzyme